MSNLRKIVDEREARACLTSMRESGETLRAWAKRNQVDGRSLHAWKRNLAHGASSSPPSKAMRLVEIVPRTPTALRGPRRYVVRIGDAEIELSDDLDAATLGRLLEVVRAC